MRGVAENHGGLAAGRDVERSALDRRWQEFGRDSERHIGRVCRRAGAEHVEKIVVQLGRRERHGHVAGCGVDYFGCCAIVLCRQVRARVVLVGLTVTVDRARIGDALAGRHQGEVEGEPARLVALTLKLRCREGIADEQGREEKNYKALHGLHASNTHEDDRDRGRGAAGNELVDTDIRSRARALAVYVGLPPDPAAREIYTRLIERAGCSGKMKVAVTWIVPNGRGVDLVDAASSGYTAGTRSERRRIVAFSCH